uniref:Uncharacterized protein n=1 Tax=Arundo donax TaxID=35708 RepID=A0A0A9ASG2_ARUDO
MNLILVNILG